MPRRRFRMNRERRREFHRTTQIRNHVFPEICPSFSRCRCADVDLDTAG
jgi:hypothetical protein